MDGAWPADAVVYLVDDDDGVRAAVAGLLRSGGLRVIAFASAEAFLAHSLADGPACAVLDIRMPGVNGLELQRRLARSQPSLSIVFLTGHGDIPTAVHAVKAGAVQFLTKPVDDHDLFEAVRSALAASAARARDAAGDADLLRRYASLTEREREIAALIVSGLRNKQVAAALGVAEITVKVHRRRVMDKMAVGSLAQLVGALARVRGLLRER